MSEIRVKSEFPYTDGWKRGAYAYANGNYTASATAYVCSEKIPCEHNANYNFICTLPDGSKDHGFLFWDKNGVFLGEIHNKAGAQTSPVSFTVETPTNCATLAINISTPTGYGNRSTEDILSFNLYSWLTLPSHEKTSTGWKDIPTHKMTATGWQGELTSQSPLEFRATGQSLLDWRIDGKTSGNLFDKNNTEGIEDNYYISQNTGDKSSDSLYYISAPIAVTSGERYYWIFRLSSGGNPHSAPTVGFYDANDNQIGVASHNSRVQSFPFTPPANCAYIRASVYKPDINEAMLVKSSIAPTSYEPYGGVGDWDETEQKYVIPVTVGGATTNLYTTAQLMDGDSLDFATDQTTIPITQGDNTLTVGTAVQPKSVFVKFEG